MDEAPALKLAAIGLAAGIGSGLFGVGGGVLMVPLLVLACGFGQHRAHVTSLAAGIFLGAAGAVTYGLEGRVDVGVAGLLALGSITGAPVGARIMERMAATQLKVAFGVLLLVMAAVFAFT